MGGHVRANDLPGFHSPRGYYHQANALWARLKGLMVYPLIVIVVSLGLTFLLCLTFRHFLQGFFEQFPVPNPLAVAMWIPPILLSLALVAGLCALLVPS
jgi:type II secretory pathway component PulF